MRNRVRQQPYFIDTYGYVLTHSAGRVLGEIASTKEGACASGGSCILRDGIHPSHYGDAMIAEVYTKCLTHDTASGGFVADGKARDGICTSTRCTQGLLGNYCADNAACDSYRCP